jgi:hypothetical protein
MKLTRLRNTFEKTNKLFLGNNSNITIRNIAPLTMIELVFRSIRAHRGTGGTYPHPH